VKAEFAVSGGECNQSGGVYSETVGRQTNDCSTVAELSGNERHATLSSDVM